MTNMNETLTSLSLGLFEKSKHDRAVVTLSLDAFQIMYFRPIETKDCTLHDELLPPAYREDVKKMIEQGRKKERKFRLNTGLSYNPFNR